MRTSSNVRPVERSLSARLLASMPRSHRLSFFIQASGYRCLLYSQAPLYLRLRSRKRSVCKSSVNTFVTESVFVRTVTIRRARQDNPMLSQLITCFLETYVAVELKHDGSDTPHSFE